MNDHIPQVSVGMPVYNGEDGLEDAIQDILKQSFKDIEIVISDNGSTDGTADICQKYAAQDDRIRYVRQPETVCATDNFNFVLKESRAPFFMWAAHDDVRSPDFIEKLLAALQNNDEAILACGDIVNTGGEAPVEVPIDFANENWSPIKRLRRTAIDQLYQLYGLWRRDLLLQLTWEHTDWWHDTPPMMAASLLGDFIHVPGPIFYYRGSQHHFFDWRHRPGPQGFMVDVKNLGRRARDVGLLIWLSGKAVTAVKGPGWGLLAATLSTEKVLREAMGFVGKRVGGSKAAEPQP